MLWSLEMLPGYRLHTSSWRIIRVQLSTIRNNLNVLNNQPLVPDRIAYPSFSIFYAHSVFIRFEGIFLGERFHLQLELMMT